MCTLYECLKTCQNYLLGRRGLSASSPPVRDIFIYYIFIYYKFIYTLYIHILCIHISYNHLRLWEKIYLGLQLCDQKTLMPWSSYIMIITIIIKDTINLIITTILPWSSSWSSPFKDNFRKTDLVLRGPSLLSRVVLVILKEDVRACYRFCHLSWFVEIFND